MTPPASRRALHWAPLLTLLVMLGPVLAGVAGTVAPALGWYPALGRTDLGLDVFRELFAWPGIGTSIWLSVFCGVVATAISLAVVILSAAAWEGTPVFRAIQRLLSPLLAVPHAAAAFGLAFLIAPSGWLARLLSPWATGWEQPLDLLIIHDRAGFALIAGLVVKEVPFLLLMLLAALPQADAPRRRQVAEALGYGRISAWIKVVLPAVYPQLRLPIYAVLAYAMSNVDMALILGPTAPPPLAVQILTWMNDPDLALRLRSAAAAVVQMGLVAGVLLLWRLGEVALGRCGRRRAEAGHRGAGSSAEIIFKTIGLTAVLISGLAVVLGLVVLALWSVAGLWTFPSALPDAMSLRNWSRQGPSLVTPFWLTLQIGALAVLAAVVFVIACLEAEYRHGIQPGSRALWLLYLPLIVPQVGFLTGIQTLMIGVGLDGHWLAVTAAHLIFVLPYVFLSLADPWRAWDPRFGTVAAALGAGPGRILWSIRLPMLLAPLLTAAAVGFAVSVGQFLPTLLIGGGRVATLTTEAVALVSGGDRRLIGVTAIVQGLLPFIGFLLALVLPMIVYANRRSMKGT